MDEKTSVKSSKSTSKKALPRTSKATPKAEISSKPKNEEISLAKIFEDLVSGLKTDATNEEKQKLNDNIRKYLKQIIGKHDIAEKYNILILYDSSVMVKSDADSIYNAVTNFKTEKPLLLFLTSNGGEIGSAYLIGKLCREYSKGNFVITVPRQAKSAATLLCCAAQEIHMGSMSELGPIDPQFSGLPALGLKNSIEHIAKLVKETPESAEMFAKYLNYSLKPIDLGYYERVAESALQYAQKLLSTHSDKLPRDAGKIAYDLVYTYKDHGFVIDKGDAQELFGKEIIKCNSEEYALGNMLYKELDFIKSVADYLDNSFYFIGSLDSDPHFRIRNK